MMRIVEPRAHFRGFHYVSYDPLTGERAPAMHEHLLHVPAPLFREHLFSLAVPRLVFAPLYWANLSPFSRSTLPEKLKVSLNPGCVFTFRVFVYRSKKGIAHVKRGKPRFTCVIFIFER